MNETELREKYGLKNKGHGIVLFIQMILIILGIVLCILDFVSGKFSFGTTSEIVLCYLFLVGYATYGYKFPIISVQIVILLVAVINEIAVVLTLIKDPTALYMIPAFIINIVAAAAAIVMKKSDKISQILLCLCLATDFVQFIIRAVSEPGQSILFYASLFQFVILDVTLVLINYSYHERQKYLHKEESD